MSDGPGARRSRHALVRHAAVLTWAVGLAAYCFFLGFPIDRGGMLLWVSLGLIAASIGRRKVWLVIVDFLPLGLVLVAYDYLRGIASTLGMPTHWHFQLEADRFLFFGHVPSAWLQARLKYAQVQWWEILVSLCYLSYFFLVLVTSGVLWLRNRRDFYRWSYRFVPLCLLAFTFFALMPASPPWAAARCSNAQVATHPAQPACMFQGPARTHGGLIGPLPDPHPGVVPYVERLSARGLHVERAEALLRNRQQTSDLVAAVPSLHSAGVLLFVIFMWRRVRRSVRVLLALYPLAMTFTLVYTGEHYVTDVLLGWACAALVSVVAARVERWLARRREPEPGEVEPPEHVDPTEPDPVGTRTG